MRKLSDLFYLVELSQPDRIAFKSINSSAVFLSNHLTYGHIMINLLSSCNHLTVFLWPAYFLLVIILWTSFFSCNHHIIILLSSCNHNTVILWSTYFLLAIIVLSSYDQLTCFLQSSYCHIISTYFLLAIIIRSSSFILAIILLSSCHHLSVFL
jgi:hypothetical protein